MLQKEEKATTPRMVERMNPFASREAIANATQTMTIKAKAAEIGLKALSIAGNMLLVAGITLAIKGIVKGFDALITTTEEHQEQLQNLRQEYDEAKQNLEDVNSQITEYVNKIKELEPYIETEIVPSPSVVPEEILEEIPDMSGYGPEATIFKAMFKTTGLYKSRTCEDAGFERALGIIRVFVRNAENAKQDFQRAYKMLLSPPYGIRKGIIPLLFAYVLKDYKEKILLYFGKNEIELSAENLSIINEVEGDKYQLLLEQGQEI